MCILFFFSSRRRHTRWPRDWSSDVCSSDLLAHGALVSCVGLTLPVVLIIGLLTGQTVTLAENPTNLLLLGISLALSIATFNSQKVTAIHGGAHLFVFILYALRDRKRVV